VGSNEVAAVPHARAIIGIPRTLLYHTYFPLWRRFFAELGAEVVTSDPTTKKTLDAGVAMTVTEACIPIKLFHGHVVNLLEKRVDYLFLPRVVCTNGRTVYCPKFLGLPDMIKSSLRSLPRLIEVRFDVRDRRLELLRAAFAAGREFARSRIRILRALWLALADHRRYLRLLQSGVEPDAAMAAVRDPRPRTRTGRPGESLRLAVIGYPYTVYDPYVSLNLLEQLRQLGARPVTAQMLTPRQLAVQGKKLHKDLFWTYSDEAIRAAFHYLHHPEEVDGLIHLTAFGCGPDSMVDKMIEIMARRTPAVPFMPLMIDEHTGEAGLRTRLEAFTDMVRRRKRAGGAAGEGGERGRPGVERTG
jgi:predicted nucleotide-binding protein (sugar kinase/HSP70/actin superfamily)